MANVLLLTNNLTTGAIPHLFIDMGEYLKEHNLYAASLQKGKDYVSGDIAESLRDAGITPLAFNFNSLIGVRNYRDFLTKIEELDIDIIHTQLIRSGVIGRLLGKVGSAKAIISTEQSMHRYNYNIKQRIMNGITLPLADKVVFSSKCIRDSLEWWENKIIPESKMRVVYNCVDYNNISSASADLPKKYNEYFDAENTILSVGRLITKKNHRILIKAFEKVTSQQKNTKLIIVGDGPLRNKIEKLAVECGVKEDIHITGWIKREKLYTLLKKSDIFAMPSVREGMGIALIEAMFTGKPIVASDIPVFHEALADTALYSENTPSSWADTIFRYISSPDIRAQNGKRAAERAHSLFDPKKIAKQHSELYCSVV